MTSDGSTRILQSPLARHPIRNGDIENPLPITTSSPSSSNRLTGKVETLWVWGQKDWKHVVVLAGGSAVLLCSIQDLFQGRVFKATLQVGGGAIAFYFIQDLRQVQEEQLERFKGQNKELQETTGKFKEENQKLEKAVADLQRVISSVHTEFERSFNDAFKRYGDKASEQLKKEYTEQMLALGTQTGGLKEQVSSLQRTKEQLSEQTEALKSQVILAGRQLDEFRRKTEEEREAFLKQLKEAQTQFQKILEERVKEASTQGAKTDHALEQIKGVAQQMSSAISGVVRRLTPPSSPTFSSSKSSPSVILPLNIISES